MKKLLFVMLLVFAGATVSAQLVTSSSLNKQKAEKRTIWMMRTGLTSASMAGDGTDDVKSIAGYNVSIEFNKHFAENWYWGSGWVFGNNGYKYGDTKLTVAKLEMPLNFGYKYPVTSDVKIDGHFGGFVNYGLFGKFKNNDEEEDLDDSVDHGGDRVGAGLQFGAGVWFQRFNFNISYQRGLTKFYGWEDVHESNLMLTIGFAF